MHIFNICFSTIFLTKSNKLTSVLYSNNNLSVSILLVEFIFIQQICDAIYALIVFA
jgi:hypothetical protein